jgi:transcription termination/antitermination protein NusG
MENVPDAERNWYAVYTRSRHEKMVDLMLRRQEMETFLPLRRQWSRRRDRQVLVDLPALPGYLFVRCALFGEVRSRLKKTPGVIRLVETVGEPCVIPEEQIDTMRLVLARSYEAEAHPYLNVGDWVEVVRGPLMGARGRLIRIAPGRHRLVVAVESIHRAIAVEIDPSDVDRCPHDGARR